MSTPTTAVATLPRFHSNQFPPSYSHHHHQNTTTTTTTTTAPTNHRFNTSNSLLPPVSSSTSFPSPSISTRLLPPNQSTSHSGYSSSWKDSGVKPPLPQSSSSPHQALHTLHTLHTLQDKPALSQVPRTDINGGYAPAMAGAAVASSMPVADGDQHSRKRRRSREPDWSSFYRNGLPKEVIVIDDTPEPEANTSRKLANVGGGAPPVVGYDSPSQQQNQSQNQNQNQNQSQLQPQHQQQPTKKRKHDGDTAATLGYHVEPVASQNTATANSSLSTDRTNSLHNITTATTSLSSQKSQHDEGSAPLKRKRITRQQIANEAKRRDTDRVFGAYKPPSLPPKKVSEVNVRVIRDKHTSKGTRVDDDDGHYIVVPDADLTEQYQITRLLGQGTFGKVVQARDRKRNKAVAVKIIRSVQKYRDASKIELRVLATLKANDAENRNRCIHFRDCFDYRGHICIVMDLLGQSIFDFLKGNSFVPFPNSQIQSFAQQLFTSVAFLHDLNLIHTDLKPENILLWDDSYQTFTYNRRIPSSSATVNRQATQRRVLLDTEIRLIDFGSATFQNEYHSSVVSTRHYRAPEIILGLGWSYPCDVWSIGCILVEFFTGDALFQTHDNLEHLAMMEAVVGSRIDPHLVQAVNKASTRSGGNAASKYFKRLKLDYPAQDTTRGSRRFVKAMKQLQEIIPPTSTFLRNFLDLLRKIFVYDPAHRITAKQALDHAWFKEMAQPDDGTEAARIRLERQRLARENSHHSHYTG